MNTFGTLFRVTTFGESHGAALGCVVDGCPSGIVLDETKLRQQLARRAPGQSEITTDRKEPDAPEILSGIYKGKSLGTPIAIIVRNRNARSEDYKDIGTRPRTGHADAAWLQKYGHVDLRGGGRASGRETVARVMAGWIAEALLDQEIPGIAIVACVTRVGAVSMTDSAVAGRWTSTDVDKHMCRCPEAETASQIEKLLIDARKTGESYGGEIVLRISGVLPGLGEPVFGKIQTQLASAMASIGSVCSVSWNRRPTTIPGSEFHAEGNTYSGTSGGITTGDELEFRLEAKPVSTTGESALAGRHDPCVLPRIVPVVESMAAILLADLYLQYNARRLKQ